MGFHFETLIKLTIVYLISLFFYFTFVPVAGKTIKRKNLAVSKHSIRLAQALSLSAFT